MSQSRVPFSPGFMYGTAWKEDQTAALTEMAVRGGCRAIDTANQRKHYFEAGVGAALKSLYADGVVKREDLFLQTKFTYERGQDHRLPYDPKASSATQVAQSFASSLEHLDTDYIDSYVLHGPATGRGITSQDKEVWGAMEDIYRSGRVRHLGISNCSPEQIRLFYDLAEIKPTFVQNRCFAVTGWDFEARQFCREHQITYQGFSLLTANRDVLADALIKTIAKQHKTGPEQIIFRFAQQIGMLPLTGTKTIQHLEADLKCGQFNLTEAELNQIERIAI